VATPEPGGRRPAGRLVATPEPRGRRLSGRMVAWWTAPAPRARVAWLRLLVYPFVFVDVLLTTSWVRHHAHVPAELHQPLALGRFLGLPAPDHLLVGALLVGLLVAAAVAATGRLPRLAGWAVFALYLWWMLVAFGYGKVDHDRFAFLVALAVLPTVGRAGRRDRVHDEGAGWALRSIQVAVAATYFLSALAKLRYVGPEWATSTILERAIARRGTDLGALLTEVPELLVVAQVLILGLELLAPLMLLEGRFRRVAVPLAAGFHLSSFATIGIIFLPHLVCLAAFLPLERLGERGRAAEARRLDVPNPARPTTTAP
jgi:hypothetical protein